MKKQNKMIQGKTSVLWNEKTGPGYYRIGLRCHRDFVYADPGQFVMLRIGDGYGPLLRRPFSIHRLTGETRDECILEILYKVIGAGTAKLSGYAKGDSIDMLGPLGNGFSLPQRTRGIMIIAGGIGVAPMFFLVEAIQKRGGDLSDIPIFIGGRTGLDLLCLDRFSGMGMRVITTTEDGSAGERGFVVEPFERALKKKRPEMIYACGPRGMLSSVAALSIKYGTKCQISIETIMACGMGACLGCAVGPDAKSGNYRHACLDGPVFEADKLMPFLSDF